MKKSYQSQSVSQSRFGGSSVRSVRSVRLIRSVWSFPLPHLETFGLVFNFGNRLFQNENKKHRSAHLLHYSNISYGFFLYFICSLLSCKGLFGILKRKLLETFLKLITIWNVITFKVMDHIKIIKMNFEKNNNNKHYGKIM